MRQIYAFLAILFFSCTVRAQGYTVTNIPFNPDPYAGGTSVGILADDLFSQEINLPFSFCFYDSTYTKLVVGSNGVVTFDTSQAGMYCPWPISAALPTTTVPMKSILAPIQDIDPSQGGSVKTATYGIAPYRRFVISYDSIPMFSCNTLRFSQQIILYESTNVIEVHLRDKPICPNWNNGYAILGLQNSMTEFLEVPGHTVPTQWTATNEAFRFVSQGLCQFVPETDTVSGKVYADVNQNCLFDGADFGIGNSAVLANGGQYYDWTDPNGLYEMLLDTGNWVITHFLPGPGGTLCPASGQYTANFPVFGLNQPNQDFADTVNLNCSDLAVDIGAGNMTRCMPELLTLSWSNNSWLTEPNAVITVTLLDSVSLVSASVPYTSLGGNVYQFSIGSLAPYQTGSATLNTLIGCDSIGTVYCVSASITGQTVDCDTTNNFSLECHALSGSFDPNDKRVAARDFAALGWQGVDSIYTNTRLEYMVRFQNTGTDTAFTVTIRDTLNPLVDRSTLVMGASSHYYRWFISGDLLLVEFPDIMLPDSGANMDASMGYFQYSARQVNGTMPGQVIYNQAAIYFDMNPPIFTNTTEQHIIQTPVVVGISQPISLKVYPNPGQDQLTLEMSDTRNLDFVMVDMMGRVVLETSVAGTAKIATRDLATGIYTWTIYENGNRLGNGRWVKQ